MIIGISGKIGTGKTTLANHLVDELGPAWQRISFADPLKREVAAILGIPISHCYDRKDDWHQWYTIRWHLQYHGQKRRERNPDYWVQQLADSLIPGMNYVIDDVRMLNEMGFIGVQNCIRIEAYEGWEPGKHAGHISETDLDKIETWGEIIYPRFGELKKSAKRLLANAKMFKGKEKD